ncbi:Cys-tRNA(Pro) deacylase [Jeotgalibacillus soli]|uniref:Cys-tRNA(Pro)/Cys-tRNA(Cys) deacylase n=1 Tax=Jeotgalibacillus soli TaxID=889306 RepID=A0A0C2W0C4_9BACL|nr:Cys-tRNA(Pro) deacylase [Jeotgalibacillus soli]KIL49638.1 hypothetical protein KP78_11060 [Jeotgalibacillus soli]
MGKGSKGKTNAMRQLDREKIIYETAEYDVSDGKIDGVSVAAKVNRSVNEVYKTLVTKGTSGGLYVFLIPVHQELSMKKAAALAGEKKIEMLAVKDIQEKTGYIRGGCSPIGMKKSYPTWVAKEAREYETIVVSAGQIGMQIELCVEDLLKITNGEAADLLQ